MMSEECVSTEIGSDKSPTKNNIVLDVQNLSKQVPMGNHSLQILNGIELQIKAGESVAIQGRSGSGKTTLLSILAGLDSAGAGRVSLLGKNLSELDEDGRARVRAQHVGFIFQSFQLVPTLTALENVMLPLDLAGKPGSRNIASDWLHRVGLGERTDHYPRQLSGGEQQRVAVARAFSSAPTLLFADEPTGNLDEETGGMILDILFSLNKEQETTLVLVTHDSVLARACDRHLLLHGGKLEEQS